MKSVVDRCRLCKIIEGMSYPAPSTAELPEFRVRGGRVFRSVGVDFCGPAYVFDVYNSEKKEEIHKAYIALFTCATSRMIHLELVPSLTAEAFIRSQIRFISRRGTPKMMLSDNAKTFKSRLVKRFNAKRGIKWRFNLARAPWWGGIFERLVRSTKKVSSKSHRKTSSDL